MENQSEQNIHERVDKRLNSGEINFEFEKYFSEGWRIFKQVCLPILGGTILLTLPLLLVYIILIPFLGLNEAAGYQYKPQPGGSIDWKEIITQMQQQRSSPQAYLKQSVFSFIAMLITAPLQAGFLLFCREADKDGGAYFGHLFKYYKGPYTGKIIAVGFINTVLSTGISLGTSFIPFPGSSVSLLLLFFIYFSCMLVVPLIIFGNASLGEAYTLSIKIVFRKLGPILGLTILFALLAMCGFIICCIGVLITFSFTIVNNYLVYKYTVGFPEDEQEQPHWLENPPPPQE